MSGSASSSSADTGNVSSLLRGPTLGESAEAPADVILGSCAWHTHSKHQVFSALFKNWPLSRCRSQCMESICCQACAPGTPGVKWVTCGKAFTGEARLPLLGIPDISVPTGAGAVLKTGRGTTEATQNGASGGRYHSWDKVQVTQAMWRVANWSEGTSD